MNPLYPTILLSLSALALLALITFSVPFVSMFYFLQVSVSGDTIRYGLWGYCSQTFGQCSRKALGYSRNPEIVMWMTKLLIFHVVAALFTLLSIFSLLPALTVHRYRDTIFPPPLYSLLVIPAALTSLIAFVFTISLFTVARNRFHKVGAVATYGPLLWMSVAATTVLFLLMLYTGCGVTWRGPLGQRSPHIRNRWSAVYAY